MPHLRLFFLGEPRIELASAPVHIGRRKAVALLAYLAVTDKGHRRDTLSTLLWPESGHQTARSALRRDLSLLRQIVGAEWFAADRNHVDLDRDTGVWVDAVRFQRLLFAARGNQEMGPVQAMLDEAVQLYRSDFLSGFSLSDSAGFDEWQSSHTESLRRDLTDTLERLVQIGIEQGEYDKALEHARRWLQVDPLQEGAHRGLMQLYTLSGRRTDALRQYEACVQTLADEFGIEPAAETRIMYEQIRTGNFSHATPIFEPEPDHSAFLANDRSSDVDKPLVVARKHELDRLHQSLDLALAGQECIRFVKGEAGQGKTTLLLEFSYQAQKKHPDLLVAVGRCEAYSGAGDSLLPFREILGMLSGDIESRVTAGVFGQEHARRLRQQAPGTLQVLLERGPDLIGAFLPVNFMRRQVKTRAASGAIAQAQIKQALEQRSGRHMFSSFDQINLFQQYIAVLQMIAQKHPLLLILDDLQWADAGSIDLLFQLGRWQADSRIMVLGAYRPADVAVGRANQRHPLEPVLNEFQRRFGDNELDLHQADNRLLVNTILDSSPNRFTPAFGEALYQHTQGNALFTIETVRAMQERGDLLQDDSGYWTEGPAIRWAQLPSKVEGVIRERLHRLPNELRDTLNVACVMGEEFIAEIVARVRKMETSQVLQQLGGPLTRQYHLVRNQGWRQVNEQRLSIYRFQHNLFQRFLYHSLGESERAFWHEQVASVLEQLYAGQTGLVAVHLARHFQEAGLLRQSLEYTQQAGEQAMATAAYAEAREHFGKALRLLASLDKKGYASRSARLHLSLGEVLYYLSDLTAARLTLEEGLAEARRLNDPVLTADALNLLSGVSRRSGDFQQAKIQLHDSLALVQDMEDEALRARVLHGLGFVEWELGNHDQARLYGEESLALAGRNGDTMQELYSLQSLSAIAYSQGDVDRKERLANLGLRKARSIGHREREGVFLNELGIAARYRGDYQKARTLWQQSLAQFQRVGRQDSVANLLANLGEVHALLNDFPSSRRHLRKALELSQLIEAPAIIEVMICGWLLAKMGQIHHGLSLLGLLLQHPGTPDVIKWEINNLYLPDVNLNPEEPAIGAQLEAGTDLALDQVVEELQEELREERWV